MKNKIVVYLADYHPVVHKGMVRLLSMFDRVDEVQETNNGKGQCLCTQAIFRITSLFEVLI